MFISQLTIPPNSIRVTYQITSQGKLVLLKNQPQKRENILRNLFGKWQGCKIELGQLNSIQLTKNNKFKDILQGNPFVSIQTPQPRLLQNKKKIKCNCKKSKCLKLYCQCFRSGLFCGEDCECINCANVELNSKRLQSLRQEMNPKKQGINTGCKCTKSNCQKKYCDCFNKGLKCTKHCNCINCKNGEQCFQFEDKQIGNSILR